MIDFYKELELENVLQCPVCFELPPKGIFVCRIGHHTCDKCRKKLTVCPTCQSPMTGTRNFLAEALLAKLSIFKGFGDGDNEPDSTNSQAQNTKDVQLKLDDNNSNLAQLKHDKGCYPCELESCISKVKLGVADLCNHLTEIHPHIVEKFKNNKATFKNKFENFCYMKKKRKYSRAIQISNMGVFFLHIHFTSRQYLHVWISAAAKEATTNRFQYLVQFTTEESNEKYTFVNQAITSLQSKLTSLESGQIFILSPKMHNLKPGNFFSLEVKVVHTPISKSN